MTTPHKGAATITTLIKENLELKGFNVTLGMHWIGGGGFTLEVKETNKFVYFYNDSSIEPLIGITGSNFAMSHRTKKLTEVIELLTA